MSEPRITATIIARGRDASDPRYIAAEADIHDNGEWVGRVVLVENGGGLLCTRGLRCEWGDSGIKEWVGRMRGVVQVFGLCDAIVVAVRKAEHERTDHSVWTRGVIGAVPHKAPDNFSEGASQ